MRGDEALRRARREQLQRCEEISAAEGAFAHTEGGGEGHGGAAARVEPDAVVVASRAQDSAPQCNRSDNAAVFFTG